MNIRSLKAWTGLVCLCITVILTHIDPYRYFVPATPTLDYWLILALTVNGLLFLGLFSRQPVPCPVKKGPRT